MITSKQYEILDYSKQDNLYIARTCLERRMESIYVYFKPTLKHLTENMRRKLIKINRRSFQIMFLRIFTFMFMIMTTISIFLIVNQHRLLNVFVSNVEKSTWKTTYFLNPVDPNKTETEEEKLTQLIERFSQLDKDQRVILLRRLDLTNKEGVEVMKTKRSLLSWPSFNGYNHHAATPLLNAPDTKLLDRIHLHQQMFLQPMFQRKRNNLVAERHPWKFEKIIHQTWIDEKIPGKTAPWVKKWLELHPDWTYMFWTDKAAHEFISEHFPALLTPFESWTIPVQKADMFRLVVLYAFGGVYADLDIEVLKNLEEVRNWSSCVLSREPDIHTYVMSDNPMNFWANNWTFTCNAFIACHSHHPFLHYLISRIVHWSPYIIKKPCKLNATIACSGPWMLSLAHAFYRRSVPEDLRAKRKELDVICPRYEYFLPTFDNATLDHIVKRCGLPTLNNKQKEVCKVFHDRGFKNEPLNYSLTTHHWFHSYHKDVNKDRLNITTLTKVLQWSHDIQDKEFYITYPED